MANPKVLILGHSFISRLGQFIATRPRLNHHFLLNEVATFEWHGIGGRTVWKTMELDLHMVASFALDIVILQLGTNDLSQLDPLVILLLRTCFVFCMTSTMLRLSVSVRHFIEVPIWHSMCVFAHSPNN